MTKKIDGIDQAPESGETNTVRIQTKTGDNAFSVMKENISPEDILEKKLEFLHMCLVPSQVPTQLPKELSIYTEAFEVFTQRTKACSDAFDDIYVLALRKFRDILLENI